MGASRGVGADYKMRLDSQQMPRPDIRSKLIVWIAFSHYETAIGDQFHGVNSIEPFVCGGWNKLLKRCSHRRSRNSLLAGTQIVSLHGFPQARLEKVSHRAKTCRARRLQIARAVGGQRVGVVNNKWLPALEARGHQQFFAAPRAQHIQIDAHVRIEKPLAKKTAFARSLNSNKNYSFHIIVALVAVATIVVTRSRRNLIPVMCIVFSAIWAASARVESPSTPARNQARRLPAPTAASVPHDSYPRAPQTPTEKASVRRKYLITAPYISPWRCCRVAHPRISFRPCAAIPARHVPAGPGTAHQLRPLERPRSP